MAVINTNITSLIGQQNLNKSASALQTAMERLSSGSRINSAKDDAAGQAIANRMSSQITGLSQAQRNANDGISVAQTTEGALNQVNDNLQRIRELTVQAQNGTNSEDDLTSIQNEIGQRLNEINRISEETGFNGVKVLQEDAGLKIQVGANDGEAISINLKKINAETLGLTGFNVDGKGETPNAAASKESLLAAGFATSDGITYTKANGNKVATASDVFSQMQNGDTVDTSTVTDNGYNKAAKDVYTYDAASESFKFAVEDVATADAAKSLIPDEGQYTYATVNIDNSPADQGSIEVRIDSEGSLSTKDGQALYLDDTGNLTQNTAGNPQAATLEKLTLSMAGTTAPTFSAAQVNTTDGTTGPGASETTQVQFSSLEAGQSFSVGDVTLTASDTMSANDVAAAFSSFVNSDVAAPANGTFTNPSGSKITDATTTSLNSNWTASSDASDTLTFTNKTTGNVTDLAVSVTGATGTGGNIKTGDTTLTADTSNKGFDVTDAEIGIEELTNLVKKDGGDVTFTNGTATDLTDDKTFTVAAEVNPAATWIDAKGELTSNSTAKFFLQENGNVTDNTGGLIYQEADGDFTAEATTKGESTENPLKALDSALKQVDSLRSDLGAIQNRFDSAITNLSTTETNLSAARSRIEDADYATEVANMTKNQILQQAGTSVLAQANQLPQSVLSLLG